MAPPRVPGPFATLLFPADMSAAHADDEAKEESARKPKSAPKTKRAGQTPAAGVTLCPDSGWNSPAIMLIFPDGVCRIILLAELSYKLSSYMGSSVRSDLPT